MICTLCGCLGHKSLTVEEGLHNLTTVLHCILCFKKLLAPTIYNPLFALDSATHTRLGTFKKPNSFLVLSLTVLSITHLSWVSFHKRKKKRISYGLSAPWKLSTVPTNTFLIASLKESETVSELARLSMMFLISATCANEIDY